MSRRGWTAWSLVAAGVSAFAGACSPPDYQHIVGPDGTPMAHVHCGSTQGACFRLAGQLCPTGYDLQPVLKGYDGNFLVRCRAPRSSVVAAAVAPCAASARSVVPSPTGWSPARPTSPPSVAVQPAAPLPPAAPPIEIDLGY